MATTPTRQEIDDYIRRVFAAYGHSPEVAVKISRAEMPDPAIWQSRAQQSYGREESYGPFQLHVRGGLGASYQQQTGLNPADPSNWKQQVEWVAKNLRSTSWSHWTVADSVLGGNRQSESVRWTGVNRVPRNVDISKIDMNSSTIGGVEKNGFQYVFPIPGWGGSVADIMNSYHTGGGSDLFAPAGSPIVSMIAGTVVSAGFERLGGNYVTIRGKDGLTYYYAHMQETPMVEDGDFVEMGQQIGKVGQTGNADGTGNHLHIGIGHGISTGAGPSGGTGLGFDAKGLLGQILGAGGAASVNILDTIGQGGSAVGGALDSIAGLIGNPLEAIGEMIAGGLAKGFGLIFQALSNELQSRLAASAFFGIGIALILVGLIGLIISGKNPVVNAAVNVVPGARAVKAVARAA